LEVDYPTIPLAELFLEKTQIVGGSRRLGMGEKDAIDLLCLLLDHEVGARAKGEHVSSAQLPAAGG
jgi:hypothetical protein